MLRLEGAGRFDMLAPESRYGKSLIEAIIALFRSGRRRYGLQRTHIAIWRSAAPIVPAHFPPLS